LIKYGTDNEEIFQPGICLSWRLKGVVLLKGYFILWLEYLNLSKKQKKQ